MDAVVESQKVFVDFTEQLRFDSPELERARAKWLQVLNGLSVNIGFPELRDLKGNSDDVRDALERARDQITDRKFLTLLKSYTELGYEPLGVGISLRPEKWIKTSDVALDTPIDPFKFMNNFFEITGFNSSPRQYHFSRSKSGGFFMMALQLTPQIHIGHGPIDSIFRLSTLAHELGHATTPRESSLEKVFLTFPDSLEDGLLTNDEHDSYLYERFLIDNFAETTKALKLKLPSTLAQLLSKRKAVQFNSHYLKNRLTYLYFAGTPLENIESAFTEAITKINPTFESRLDFDWLNYATLANPLSGIGFLKAYRSVFRSAE